MNLYFDYKYLCQFASESMPDNQIMFEISMGELQQLISLFVESSHELTVREILDEELYRKKYTKVNMRKLIMILDKFKDDKMQASP